jgi:hypothetical protein
MAYIINRFDGTPLVVLDDGSLNTTTSVTLLGRNYIGYGETQNENFLHLLENFANTNPPSNPIDGQTWFDRSTKSLNVYTGDAWTPVNSATLSTTQPIATPGSLWYNTDSSQLFLFSNDQWKLIGPESITGFGITKFESSTVIDTENTVRPIVKAIIDNTVIAICAKNSFTISLSNEIPGFLNINPGINFASGFSITGNLIGNASTASKLAVGKRINGVLFDGNNDITIKSTTTKILSKGSFIVGENFDGSVDRIWSVDATSSSISNKIVARDSSGNFSAGVITANLNGNVSGNVTTTIGTSTFNRIVANEIVGSNLSGNALTATRLLSPRQINGVWFDGSANITVGVSGMMVTGNRLASNIVESSITSLGTLTSLSVGTNGLSIGGNTGISLRIQDGVTPRLFVNNSRGLVVSILDPKQQAGNATFEFISSDSSVAAGGTENPTFIGDSNSRSNIGLPSKPFKNIYAEFFIGTATQAQYADLAENYVSDAEYDYGTVLEFGGDFEVTLAQDSTKKVAGVVSRNPAYLMNSNCSGNFVVPIALQGRVPCKVIGPIKKGDLLVSGGNGYAKASVDPCIGSVIGKSLENFDGSSGIIEVAVGRL